MGVGEATKRMAKYVYGVEARMVWVVGAAERRRNVEE